MYLSVIIFNVIKFVNSFDDGNIAVRSASYAIQIEKFIFLIWNYKTCLKVVNQIYRYHTHAAESTKIWNALAQFCKPTISLQEFKYIIKTWNGPNCKCTDMFVNWVYNIISVNLSLKHYE